MSDSERGQVSRSAAEVYEEFFVPALFAEWAGRVADAAHVTPGMRVLDVACGTGILARTVAERVGQNGSVVGLDVNEGMLAVAQHCAPQVEWHQGHAESLPLPSQTFDAVVSQFGMMFFHDRMRAIQEMARVVRPGGYLAFAVWDSLAQIPGYRELVALLQRHCGEAVANGLRAPFVMGDVGELRALCHAAGMAQAAITTHRGRARFPSIEQWIYTDIKGWTLADAMDDEHYVRLVVEAQKALRRFVQPDGSVAFPSSAHIVSIQV